MADEMVDEFIGTGNVQMRLLAALATKLLSNRGVAVMAGAGVLGTDGAGAGPRWKKRFMRRILASGGIAG